MKRSKNKAPAPTVWHPAWCACRGSGILSEPDGPLKRPNGETTWKHGARCPGLPVDAPTPAPTTTGTTPPDTQKDRKRLAAGEREDGP